MSHFIFIKSFKSSSIRGAIENKDEIVKVNKNIDGKVQTIDLKIAELGCEVWTGVSGNSSMTVVSKN